ncbi:MULTISPECIES: ABC transporter substrate-binding protein [Rhodopseudomonas]|uniref:ABC transporter substrate-binding protein n=1 Tax=Rhodopseudomonas TaxID=1073 RepID=UPI0005CB3084|nr:MULTISPECIES: ABC transporter substrate-binding protein [Rhodopseudomonas]MDF3813786.1 ABC transporter substrate-binding protein [Rhodopseudomonas sp. BAL398]WOK17671.1 ABC transporter substrate-binding protein [Rhodopseudomonas sp. BAL398]
MKLSRRLFLTGSTIALAAPAFLRQGLAQSSPIKIGSLIPLSGGGAPYGPEKNKAHLAVVEQVNAAGGVLGRKIELITENSETNPEAAVRAARKLIDADQVSAIIGTWASSVTLGIMPLCQEANVVQLFTGSSDFLPDGDKKHLCYNLQPLNKAWCVALAGLAAKRGLLKVGFAGPKNDFAASMGASFGKALKDVGGEIVGEPLYYNPTQISYRAEAEKLIASKAPALFLAGYVTDFTALYRELIRGGYTGKVIALSFAIGPDFKKTVGSAANGILHGSPVPPVGKDTYDAYLRLVGLKPNGQILNPYGCAAYDEINLLLLAMTSAKSTDPRAVADHIMKVANGPGERATNFAEGAKLLAAGKSINYDGASSSADFLPNGMLKSRDFALYEIQDGKDVPILTISSSAE